MGSATFLSFFLSLLPFFCIFCVSRKIISTNHIDLSEIRAYIDLFGSIMSIYSSHSLLAFILSLFGVWISFYTQYVKYKSQSDNSYRAFCDIGSVSCTKVFRSEYGDGFGLLPDGWKLSNGECGVMFYSVLTLLSK